MRRVPINGRDCGEIDRVDVDRFDDRKTIVDVARVTVLPDAECNVGVDDELCLHGAFTYSRAAASHVALVSRSARSGSCATPNNRRMISVPAKANASGNEKPGGAA